MPRVSNLDSRSVWWMAALEGSGRLPDVTGDATILEPEVVDGVVLLAFADGVEVIVTARAVGVVERSRAAKRLGRPEPELSHWSARRVRIAVVRRREVVVAAAWLLAQKDRQEPARAGSLRIEIEEVLALDAVR